MEIYLFDLTAIWSQLILDLRFEILDWSIDPTDKIGGQVSSDTGFLFPRSWVCFRNEFGGLYPGCFRSFRAGVFNLNILNTMQSLGSELKKDETTLVLVSGKRAITKEWRFFVKNQIITGSLYWVEEERVDETIRGGYLENYLSEVFCPSELVSRICLHDRYLRVRGRALCLGTWFF